MKKVLSLLIVVCVTALFVSCQKEGVYNPSKKISKVTTTYQYTYYLGDESETVTRRYSAVWKWNKNTLEQISEYDSDGSLDGIIYFSYDNNRLSRLQNGSGSYLEYHYQGSKLSTADYFSNGALRDSYTFTYKNGNIVKVEEQYYGGSYKNAADKDDFGGMEIILGHDMAQYVSKAIQKHQAKDGSKGSYKYIYDLTWSKNNVVKVEFSDENDPTWKVTIDAEYDSYNNPYYGIFWTGDEYEGFMNHSKNNVTKMTYTETDMNDIDIEVDTYQYTYDGKYPKTRRIIYADGEAGSQVEYEYTK